MWIYLENGNQKVLDYKDGMQPLNSMLDSEYLCRFVYKVVIKKLFQSAKISAIWLNLSE